MRPNTRSSGILSTKRSNPVSTSRLTRMLVPKPKNAFQSPATHRRGRKAAGAAWVAIGGPSFVIGLCYRPLLWERVDQLARAADPAEDPALRTDHVERGGMELGEVGRHAVVE